MKKIILLIALLIGMTSVNAQTDEVNEQTKSELEAQKAEKQAIADAAQAEANALQAQIDAFPGWRKGGNILLTFNQSAFNNEWTGGGVGNIAANLLINYDFNLLRDNYIWDNKLLVDYGVNKNKGASNFTKNNDRIEFNSIAGKKASGNWFYSAYLNARTQLDRGADGGTHFFSPAYFQAGPGMFWKKSDNLSVMISPAAAKLIVVHSEYTAVVGGPVFEGLFNDAGGYFGVDANETTRFEIGAALRAYYKLNIAKSISMENILALYSNYLEDPQNVDLDYTMNLSMSVNKYISANLVFQAIYDDNANRNGFQIRESFGVGFSYGF
jgi:type II secretory pathway pseudopilin PulG